MQFQSKKTILVVLFIIFILICVLRVSGLLIKMIASSNQDSNSLQLMNDASQSKYIQMEHAKYINSDLTFYFREINTLKGDEQKKFVVVFCGNDTERTIKHANTKSFAFDINGVHVTPQANSVYLCLNNYNGLKCWIILGLLQQQIDLEDKVIIEKCTEEIILMLKDCGIECVYPL